jgi:hypothetical protein
MGLILWISIFALIFQTVHSCETLSCSNCLLGVIADHTNLVNDSYCYWCPSFNRCARHESGSLDFDCDDHTLELVCAELQCPLKYISFSPYTCTIEGKIAAGLNAFSLVSLTFSGVLIIILQRKWKKRLLDHQSDSALKTSGFDNFLIYNRQHVKAAAAKFLLE